MKYKINEILLRNQMVVETVEMDDEELFIC
jgi:hypothetical protein